MGLAEPEAPGGYLNTAFRSIRQGPHRDGWVAPGDTVNGSAGRRPYDVLGGRGFLTGGAGSDTFVLQIGQAAGTTITDFVTGTDHLDFTGYGTEAQGRASR